MMGDNSMTQQEELAKKQIELMEDAEVRAKKKIAEQEALAEQQFQTNYDRTISATRASYGIIS